MATPRVLELTERGESGESGGSGESGESLRAITCAELARHGPDSGDAWIRVGPKVVGVQQYADAHPGGRATILEFAGQDATDAFNVVRHSRAALKELRALVVGEMADGNVAVSPAVDVEVPAPPLWSADAELTSVRDVSHDSRVFSFNFDKVRFTAESLNDARAENMVALEERMKGPRFDCCGPWAAAPRHVVLATQ